MSNMFRVIIGSLSVLALCAAGLGGNVVATAARNHSSVTGTVFMIGPETFTGRWVRDDAYVKAQLHKKCPKCAFVFQNGNNDYNTQLSDAQNDLATSGKKVIILAAVDSYLDAGIVDRAAQQHVPVIAYDRMIQDPKLLSYVSFNAAQVGAVQARYLLYSLAQKKVSSGNIVQIWGSANDNNALLFRAGFASAFDKHFKCPASSPDTCGTAKPQFTDAYHTYTPGWNPGTAATEMQNALGKVQNKVAGVYSMNDGMADTIAPSLANVGLSHVPLTGQDDQPSSLARILKSTQGMTVYKPPNEEGNPAVTAAVWYLQGHYNGSPPGFSTKNSQCKQSVGNGAKIPCVIGGVKSITYKPIKQLGSLDVGYAVGKGYITWKQVCADVIPSPPSQSAKYCGLKH